MASNDRANGRLASARAYDARADEYRDHAETIRRALLLPEQRPASKN